MDYIKLAKAVGFHEADVMNTCDLVIIPKFRELCAQNICGNYNKALGCPPKCGTVDHMVTKINAYSKALILKTKTKCNNIMDREEQEAIQAKQNKLTQVLYNLMVNDGMDDLLFMSAGPWGSNSCLSAYCIHAQKMAESVGMTCWKNDGFARYFTLILYNE